ncbi:MAG: preprotein translocase subunit TatC [Devosia sp.]|uniref:group III truncated hemoglobin n=1 Tax=Devosia sp. TaxID=1871048 RepID=UPI002612296E|nr:group III truncated hemoglobin [Devosia sp.]MDB5538060.1 preprotein translocase subunit TatC [Devosia sp.]MDB5586795.1 preprotein translocase subunit TatC [Devosia sp.]
MTDPVRPPVGTRLTRTGWEIPEALDEPMVRAVVDSFYAKARADDVIGPVFNRVIAEADWPEHIDKITSFWSSMLLGTGTYGGRPMPKHMAIPELSDMHFSRWLALFRQTAQELCPPDVAELFIERSERVGQSFRLNIAVRRGEDVTRMGPLPRE